MFRSRNDKPSEKGAAMCFRPAETELPPVVCPSCGKRINRVAGQLPTKCPFCKTPTDGIDDVPQPAAPGAPAAAVPKAPGAPAAPKAPSAPAAPAPAPDAPADKPAADKPAAD